jgi:hypothetical protein
MLALALSVSVAGLGAVGRPKGTEDGMTHVRRMAEVAVAIGACALAACDGGSIDPGGAGGVGGGGGAGGQVPAPAVPGPGQFVWTAGGVTIAASDGVTLNGLKAVGYRFQGGGGGLIIEAQTEQSQSCLLMTRAPSLPAPGTYPVDGYGSGTFQVLCTDPTSAVGSRMYVTGGAVVLTKAETNDVEGTFTVSGVPEAASGGFNVRCIHADCTGPQRP